MAKDYYQASHCELAPGGRSLLAQPPSSVRFECVASVNQCDDIVNDEIMRFLLYRDKIRSSLAGFFCSFLLFRGMKMV